MNTVKITGDYILLGQLLKVSQLAEHGGAAKVMIQQGEVQVNGETVLQRGKKIVPGDEITACGQTILVQREQE